MRASNLFKNLVCLVLVALLGGVASYASEKSLEEAEKDFNPTDMIMHHIGDSHGWHFFGENEDAVTLPLPVILYTDAGDL